MKDVRMICVLAAIRTTCIANTKQGRELLAMFCLHTYIIDKVVR
jgi:hypothetical protein